MFIQKLTESFESNLRDMVMDALEFLDDYDYPFPKNKYLADSWEDWLEGIKVGEDPVIETAECLIEFLQKERDIDKRLERRAVKNGDLDVGGHLSDESAFIAEFLKKLTRAHDLVIKEYERTNKLEEDVAADIHDKDIREEEYKGVTIEYFPYTLHYGDKSEHIDGWIIKSPYYIQNKNGKKTYMPLYLEDETGETINLHSLQEAKDYIDKYIVTKKGKIVIKYGDEAHYQLGPEKLDEDTVKQKNGKWVNKGEAGTHGEFKTKKAADAQRKAIFASGWHESLDETYKKYQVNEALSESEKVDMWANGTRIVNVGACSVDKLNRYYRIAEARNYTDIMNTINRELAARNLSTHELPNNNQNNNANNVAQNTNQNNNQNNNVATTNNAEDDDDTSSWFANNKWFD